MELIKKFFQFALGNIIILLIGLVTTPVITCLVTPEVLGKYSLFNTIGNLCVLLCMMGTDQAFVRFYYEENENARGRLSKILMKFCLGNVMLMCICFLLFKNLISRIIIGSISPLTAIGLSLFVLFNVIYSIVLLELRIKQRLNMYNILHTLQKLLYLFFIMTDFHIGIGDVAGLVAAVILSYAGSALMGILIEHKTWLIRPKIVIETSHHLKEMLFFGLPILFSSIIAWVFQASDKFMLKFLSNYRELGIYSSTIEIIILLNAVQAAFTTFWIPVAYEHYKNEPDNTCFYTKVNQIISFFMFNIAIFLIMGKSVLGILLGKEYWEAIYSFPFLMFMPIMYTISETTVLGINFKKKTTYHIWISIISATSNIILNALFIPAFGARGAAIGTGLGYFVFWAGRTVFSLKCYKVDYNLGRFLMTTLLVYIYAAYSSFHISGYVTFIWGICLILILCFLYKEILKWLIKEASGQWKIQRRR